MTTKLVITQNLLLLVSGALLLLVGTLIVVSPADFYSANNIDLGANVSLLNELKAPAGLLMVAGSFIIGAVFMRDKAELALWLAVLIYLSYAVSRSASMAFDGLPATGLIMATALEAAIGLTCLVVLFITKTQLKKVA